MDPLEVYYVNQAGRGLTTTGIGTIYSPPLFLQLGHSIGNFFGSLLRWVRPLLWSGAKAVGRETLCTAGKILTYIAKRQSSNFVSAGDIVSKHVTESAENLISKLRGSGLKRVHGLAASPEGKVAKCRKSKRALIKIIKREIFP